MGYSFYQVWLHAIFTTKDRKPLLTSALEDVLFPFLYNEFSEMGCQLKIVNGLTDHIHCLFMIDGKTACANILKQVKGASSHYINQQEIIKEKFTWEKGYAIYSVSNSMVPAVYKYIKKQKITRMTLEQEGFFYNFRTKHSF